MKKKYIGINVGPVVATLMLARKPRELWGASYIFSYLMKCIIRKFTKNGLTLLSPWYDESDNRTDIGLYPDRAFFRQEEDREIDVLLEEAWGKFGKDTGLIDCQDYFNIMTLELENESEVEAIMDINSYFDGLELSKKASNAAVQSEIINLIGKTKDSNLFDVAFGIRDYKIKTLEDYANIERGENAGMPSNIPERSHHRYICIIQADGDGMGNVIKALEEGKLSGLSEKLIVFGKRATEIIKEAGGLPIYAGGDDLLFIVPVIDKNHSTVFTLLDNIDAIYRDEVQEYVNKCCSEHESPPCTSMSYGVSITYYKFPLYEAWKLAQKQLFGVAKKYSPKKNTIAVSLQKHSGSTLDMVLQKDNSGLKDLFNDLMRSSTQVKCVGEAVVTGVIHKMRQNEILLHMWVNLEKEDDLSGRLLAFFRNTIEYDPKLNTIADQYKKICMEITKEVIVEIREWKREQEVNHKMISSDEVRERISRIYSLLRIAKFTNGEEVIE